MSHVTFDRAAHVLWSTVFPGTVPIDVTVEQVAGGLDPASATAGDLLFSRDGGATVSTWPGTLVAVAAGSVIVRHYVTTGDLVPADTRRTCTITATLTHSGVARPCDAIVLPVEP